MSRVVIDEIQEIKNAFTTMRHMITLIMDDTTKSIMQTIDVRENYLTGPKYLQSKSIPPLPDLAGKNHTRRHKKKRGKKTRNNRN